MVSHPEPHVLVSTVGVAIRSNALRGIDAPPHIPPKYRRLRGVGSPLFWSRSGTGFELEPDGRFVLMEQTTGPQPSSDPQDAPETPPTEPEPAPVQDPPAEPNPVPYVVRGLALADAEQSTRG